MNLPKSRLLRGLLIALALLTSICAIVAIDNVIDQRNLNKIKPLYLSASPLKSYSTQPSNQHAPVAWKHDLRLKSGTLVTVEAISFMNDAHVTYSDSKESIVVAPVADYIYPQDLRIDMDREILYVYTNGLAGGVFPASRLYQFDLAARRLIRKASFKPKDFQPK